MASVRSISASKPPERLLKQRLAPTSSVPASTLSQRKLGLSKKTQLVEATPTTSRQKSSRMTSKKGSTGPTPLSTKVKSSNTDIATDNNDLPTDQMASMKLDDISAIRPISRASYAGTTSTSVIDAESIKSVEEKPCDTNEASSLPVINLNNSQFTLESFDTIRTIGTGKNFIENKINKRENGS